MVAILAAAMLVSSGCTSSSEHQHESMASTVTLKDPWANSADKDMAAVFGTLTNTGDHEARIVAGESPLAGRVEIHEVTPDATGAKVMHPKEGGIAVPADGTQDLVPGGDHIMLMDLKGPLRAGADVDLTLTFEDGSTLPVTAQIRDFAGAGEEYQPNTDTSTGVPHHGHG